MLVAILALALGNSAPAVIPPSPVRICNAMRIKLDGVRLDPADGGPGLSLDVPLKPGACVDAAVNGPGDYTLRFVELGPKGETAMCARRVTVKDLDTIRISPDDGAQCIM